MTDCEGMLHPRALVGIHLLNARKYFEAHEELEAAWKEERGRVRDLYQGILEAAVTYLHIVRGNYPGAIKVYARSMRWLKSWQNTCRGVDVEQLRIDLRAVMAELERLGETRIAEFDRGLLKPVIWKEDSDGA
jgi:predicted metal-dependent hydrolase